MKNLTDQEKRNLVKEAYDCIMRLNVEYITDINDETIQRIQRKLNIRHARRFEKFRETLN